MVVPFSSNAGQTLFATSHSSHINWRVIECAVPQQNACYCGPATLVTALSSIRATAGTGAAAPGARTTTWLNQDQLFEGDTAKICTREQVLGHKIRTWSDGTEQREVRYSGMSLEEVTQVLALHFPTAAWTYASDATEQDLEAWLLKAGGVPAIFNFLGAHLGLPLGGHFAIAGAFNAEAGRALILDPARHKVGWYWVRTRDLLEAMRKIRPGLERARGWITVDHGTGKPEQPQTI